VSPTESNGTNSLVSSGPQREEKPVIADVTDERTIEDDQRIDYSIEETEAALVRDLPKRPELEITFFDVGYDVFSWNVKRCRWDKKTVIDGVR
jgi:hypothetical protein